MSCPLCYLGLVNARQVTCSPKDPPLVPEPKVGMYLMLRWSASPVSCWPRLPEAGHLFCSPVCLGQYFLLACLLLLFISHPSHLLVPSFLCLRLLFTSTIPILWCLGHSSSAAGLPPTTCCQFFNKIACCGRIHHHGLPTRPRLLSLPRCRAQNLHSQPSESQKNAESAQSEHGDSGG